jgi:phosphatidylserine/phosphatidylglycerophosphate/cardiolipin synthase-like enzyme
MGVVSVLEWFLSAAERRNAATLLDRRHADGMAWTSGNKVQPLVHGSEYFPALLRCVLAMTDRDVLMFTDWRGDPDQRLTSDGPSVSAAFAAAAARGVVVKGLLWRSHLDRFAFSEQENRHLGEEIDAAGGECLRDMRVRPLGSHHQKFVVARHIGRLGQDVAFVGGIDLCHSRLDGPEHLGDPQRQTMAAVYGDRPPWHDLQVEIRGPAVGDVETVFRERWEDSTPLTRNPIDLLSDLVRRDDHRRGALPPRLPDPPAAGAHHVQLLRTYPCRRRPYPFAPDGERSVAHAYDKVIARASSLIYLEDQYLWSEDVVHCFAQALASQPKLRLIAVVPLYPDQDGRWAKPPNLIGRQQALDMLRQAGGDRVAVYGIENNAGTPVYVHAKVCVVDDVWAAVGSDNINLRSWTHDSELSCAVLDEQRDSRQPEVLDRFGDGARVFARELRLRLAREHLDRVDGDDDDLVHPLGMFHAYATTAEALQLWHEGGRIGRRPPGRLRPYPDPHLSPLTLRWAKFLYRTVYDPDGRPRQLRRTPRF